MRMRYWIASGIGRVMRDGRSKNRAASMRDSSSAAAAAGSSPVSTACSLRNPANPPLCTIQMRNAPLLAMRHARHPRRHTHRFPGAEHDARRVRAEPLLRHRDRLLRGVAEVGVRAEPLGERLVPDRAGLFPGMAAESTRRLVERLVRDAGIDVYAAVVVRGVDVVLHVGGLGILADPRIV